VERLSLSIGRGPLSESSNSRWATVIIMVIAVTAVTIGDLFMSQAMRELGPLELVTLGPWWAGELKVSSLLLEIYELGWLIFTQGKVWVAIIFMLTFLVLWMVALSWSDLTFVMPLTALTYVFNAILVGPFLGEEVTPLRWFGTLLIAAGVALVGAEPDRTTSES